MGKVRHDSESSDDIAIKKNSTKVFWTIEEDELLKKYVDQNGDGNWTDVQKYSSLSRNGKSCRLRWMNHLRPELKQGAFTKKEEESVIKLHALLGNKWAQMARELPGRTDNEIKNFWNKRLKRLQRFGSPFYSDEVRGQAINAQSQSGLNIESLDVHNSQDTLEADRVEIPEMEFKHSPLNQWSSYYNVPTTGGFQPNMNNLRASPYMPSRKRLREQETAFRFMGGYAKNEQSPPVWNYPFGESTSKQLSDSHLLGNDTYSSSSGPLINEVEKVELPSFQCFNSHEDPGNLGAQQYNIMPAFESDNTLVQPPLTVRTPENCPSSLYDGLLESMVYGSSGEIQGTDTNSESPLFQSSLLGQTELTPASENTIEKNFQFETNVGYFGSTSSNERLTSFDDDWIKLLLGDDRDNTK